MKQNRSENKRAKAGKQSFLTSILYFLLLSGPVLFLQTGCQEQAGPSDKSKATLATPDSQAGQEKATTTRKKTPAGKGVPKIKLDKLEHDFGDVGPNTKQTGEFKITNTGKGLLEITRVQKCCGANVELSKEELEPGKSATLKVTYKLGTRTGTVKRQLHVYSNDPFESKVTLTITANVVTKVEWQPNRLKLFLEKENANCPEITIACRDNVPFSITNFKSTANCISADYDPSAKAMKFVLTPKVDMEKLQNNLKGRIDIELSHPELNRVTITFDVLPRFTLSPQQIIVFKAEPQKPTVRKVWVLSNYDEDFEIESTSSKNNTIKVLSQEKIRNGYELKVEIVPPPVKDKESLFTDTFSVNIKGGGKETISCRGFYRQN